MKLILAYLVLAPKVAHATATLPALAASPEGVATTLIQLVSRGLEVETVTNPTNHDADISANPSTCAEADFVNCILGYVDGIRKNGQTCEDACIVDGVAMCCDGYQSCTSFTGKVCKDGSCSGVEACYYANIPEVINSCKPWYEQQNSDRSCRFTNYRSASAATTVATDSCWGSNACLLAGYSGTIGNIKNSCHGTSSIASERPCGRMGEQGVVGDVINSCYGKGSCYQVGYQTTEPGITTIKDCCDGKDGTTPVSDECKLAKTDANLIAKDESCVGLPTTSPTSSKAPSKMPSVSPSKGPSVSPSSSPTAVPTGSPTTSPTSGPSRSPSKAPSKMPSVSPSKGPSVSPSSSPTAVPTGSPTTSPVTSLDAIYEIINGTITDISGPAEKSLAKILVDLNEDPVDLAGAIKNAKKALKKLKCPGDPEDDAAVKACEAIDEAIELLEQAYDAGNDRGLQVEGTDQADFFGIDVALEPQAVVEDGINSATSTTGMTVFAGLVALIYSML